MIGTGWYKWHMKLNQGKQNMSKRYGFLSITRKFGDTCGKKLMGTAAKIGKDVAKTAPKKSVKKTSETTRDLIGNKNNFGRQTKKSSKEEDNEANKMQEINIPPDKLQNVIDDLRLF